MTTLQNVHNFLGITVGHVHSNLTPIEKRNEYLKDIVYVTNSEIGFDYLRDNMKIHAQDLCFSNGFNFAIVDEADSILIDEARTPLIISGPAHGDLAIYSLIDQLVQQLSPNDYEIDEKHKSIQLTDSGDLLMEAALKRANVLKHNSDLYGVDSFALLNHILQALKARYIFKKNTDYIVRDGKVMIVDEFTGRIMDGRRYSEGLHQAIEAKEAVQIMPENQTLASVTYQNFFRMYKKLGCMTGTAKTEAAEFKDIYNVNITSIPTNKPIARQDLNDLIYRNEDEKFESITNAVKESNDKGQPVLIGTVSIEKSEKLSSFLKKAGIKHSVLNAKNHEKEAEIIADAGCFGSVTIATNMAGRGTDIMLGGNLKRKIQSALETFTGTEEEKANLIENITSEYNQNKEKVIDAGGLFVIGSERHESRRIDNQLRGRSGRQGDVGKSRFYLSLTDDLLRIFGGDKIQTILSRVGFKPGESMEHGMLNKVISSSQVKVETFHYEMRKNVIKYDDVINQQRHNIYDQRMMFMQSEDTSKIVKEIFKDSHQYIVEKSNTQYDKEHLISDDTIELFHNEYLINKSILIQIDKFGNIDQFFENLYNLNIQNINPNIVHNIQKEVLLMTLDECWREHLYAIDHVRSGIHLRSFAQKDPFTEYKIESFKLFDYTMKRFAILATQRFLNIRIEVNN
jgi:preprotein translocase subunit SecA